MRLIDADALAEEIEKDMKNGFPANKNLSLYAISCIAHAPTVCDIEDIKADIEAARYGLINDGLDVALRIIDKHTEGRM